MNNNIVDSIIASIIFAVLSTGVGIILQLLGFSTQAAIFIALIVLLALMLLFLAVRRFYPIAIRWLTEQLLEKALNLNPKVSSEIETAFKKRIVERVLQENPKIEQFETTSIIVFPNQEACESNIQEASQNARKIKILTIRGEKYFIGTKSLLYDLYSSKRGAKSDIEVLVLSPESQHLTEQLAANLGHASSELIRRKMRITLDYLMHIADQNKNIEVKCYYEAPIFKILIFDDVMFVSSFAVGGGPKNDHNAKMLQIKRDGNPLFTGFDRYFEELSKRSVAIDKGMNGSN